MNVFVNGISARDGGGITYVNSLVDALSRVNSGIRTVVFVSPSVVSEFERIGSIGNVSLEPVRQIQRSILGRMWWEQATLPGLARGSRNGVLLSPGNVCCFRWPGPQVLVVQSIAPFCRDAQRGKGARNYLRYLVLRLLTRLSFRVAQVVVVNSTATQSIVLQNGCPAGKIRVIPLGRSEVFARYAEENDIGQAPDDGYLLTVGALSAHKNLEVTIKAIALLRDRGHARHLRIVGPVGSDSYFRRLKALVSDLGVADLVEFVGPVPYEQLPSVYAHAGAFVLTSLVENFPHTLVEAMSVGCLVVSGQQIPTREICGDAGMECDARNPSDVALKIECVLSDAALRSRMRASGLVRARELDWNKLAAEYVAVFRQLATE